MIEQIYDDNTMIVSSGEKESEKSRIERLL